MSEENKEASKVSVLDQIKVQRLQLIAQRDFAQGNLNQLIGAVHACDMMIQIHEQDALKQEPAGGQGNGETDSETKEQAAEE
jgi:hypothetical protein